MQQQSADAAALSRCSSSQQQRRQANKMQQRSQQMQHRGNARRGELTGGRRWSGTKEALLLELDEGVPPLGTRSVAPGGTGSGQRGRAAEHWNEGRRPPTPDSGRRSAYKAAFPLSPHVFLGRNRLSSRLHAKQQIS
uniref:Uncharacterized protein n=1 Tax=Oryza brachyantha TaxID=4533 RepID=J3L074_ORYBR